MSALEEVKFDSLSRIDIFDNQKEADIAMSRDITDEYVVTLKRFMSEAQNIAGSRYIINHRNAKEGTVEYENVKRMRRLNQQYSNEKHLPIAKYLEALAAAKQLSRQTGHILYLYFSLDEGRLLSTEELPDDEFWLAKVYPNGEHSLRRFYRALRSLYWDTPTKEYFE